MNAGSQSLLDPGRNCWRVEPCGRGALIIDAADYFRHARRAMLNAKHQLLLIGWDFDTRIHLDPDADEGPGTLGAFLSWLPKRTPGLQIHILKWDVGAIKLLGRGTTIARVARWMSSENITFKLDGAHPTGASHHQKIVVIDDALAFCGGIDMTACRWDTRDHRDDDEGRRRPTTNRRYGPWHDASMAVDGPAAKALGDLARERWILAGGEPIGQSLTGSDPWPEGLKPDFTDVEVAVARTRGEIPQARELREIEALYVDLIRRAKRFVYAENQYFASRKVAEAIAERLAEPDGPEFVIVNPCSADGWLEETVMGSARARLFEELQKIGSGRRFRIYWPVTEAGEPIYVHSKITIADDEILRVGSANLNNRSMGLDSECDLALDANWRSNGGVRGRIEELRNELIAEHLGVEAGAIRTEIEQRNSLIGAIEALRGQGRSLMPYFPEPVGAAGKAVAESEALDPESAGELFEPIESGALVRNVRRLAHRQKAQA